MVTHLCRRRCFHIQSYDKSFPLFQCANQVIMFTSMPRAPTDNLLYKGFTVHLKTTDFVIGMSAVTGNVKNQTGTTKRKYLIIINHRVPKLEIIWSCQTNQAAGLNTQAIYLITEATGAKQQDFITSSEFLTSTTGIAEATLGRSAPQSSGHPYRPLSRT